MASDRSGGLRAGAVDGGRLASLGLRLWTGLGIGLLASIVLVSGCATRVPPTLHPLDQKLPLEPEQGILVVEVEASETVLRLLIEPASRLSGSVSLTNLAAGRRAKLLVLPAGTYRWTEIDLQGYITVNDRTYPMTWVTDDDDAHWQFEVRPGVVNYPGLLVLSRVGPRGLRMYTLNRSAQLVQTLREAGSGLLTERPIVYSGRGRDDFLEFYAAQIREEGSPKQVEDEAPAHSN